MYNTYEEKKKRPINKGAVARIVIWSAVLCILCGVFSLLMLSEGVLGRGLNLGAISVGGYTYEDAGSYSVGAGSYDGTIHAIDVDWVSGAIDILPTDESSVRIEEDYGGDDEDLYLRWRVENGELSVKYRKSYWSMGFKKHAVPKHLTIYVPHAMLEALNEVELDVVDSDVYFCGRTRELNLDAVRGRLKIEGHVDELDMDLVDGALDFSGTLGRGDLDGVEFTASFRLDAAQSLDIDGVEQEVILHLADSVTGFRISRGSLGGDTVVEGFENVTTLEKDGRCWGDGSLTIDVDGVDAKVTVKKTTKN